MELAADEVIRGALRLPPRERAELAARLIESLDEGEDADAEVAWDAEIARRIRDLNGGAVEPIPWPEARRMILGRHRAPAHGHRRPGYWRGR